MALRLFNTRTRTVEEFKPMVPGKVSIYVCGMTPSFHPHLGHARTFLIYDVFVRYLRAKGFDVTYVRNVTDIDDRIIDRSKKDGVPWNEVVSRYYGEFEQSATKLGLLEPSVSPRATNEMPGIIVMIEQLVELGAAYETGDGVYFSVDKDTSYGSLSRRNLDELRAGERVAVREEKRDPLDFALWKKAKPGEPTWDSPWGPGRPGWHIECSAMCKHYLGEQFDIHGGATDLVFPHHENEIAQTETATGKHPMAFYWVHAGLLNVDNQKMSKSLGNFKPLTEILEQYNPFAVRYLFLQTGYRKPSNFTPAALEAATKGLRGLYDALDVLRDAAASQPTGVHCAIEAGEFDAFLDNDLDTAGAVGWLQTKVREARSGLASSPSAVAPIVALAERCLDVLGLPPSAEAAGFVGAPRALELRPEHRIALRALAGDGEKEDAALVDHIVALRDQARARKDFATSDLMRDALQSAGIVLRDTKNGTQWSPDGGR
jgi:cysteinyl-tRNA synthetase